MPYLISTWNHLKPFGPKADLYRAIDSTVEAGLGVELWLDWTAEPGLVSWENRGELKSRCRGAAALSAHSALIHRFDPEALRREIDLCAFLGADPLVVHPRSLGLEAGAWDAEADARLPGPDDLRRIESFLALAEERSVRLALENGPPGLLRRVLDGLETSRLSGRLGICIDTGHANLHRDRYGEPAAELVRLFADRLLHLHLADNRGGEDEHRVPGRGTVDWAAVLAELRRGGFRGSAALELWDEDPWQAARDAASFLDPVARSAGFDRFPPA